MIDLHVIGLAIALALASLLVMLSRLSRLTLIWGGLWGSAMGVWILAPLLLRAHHYHAATILEWVVAALALCLIFFALGAALSFLALSPMALWNERRPLKKVDLFVSNLVVGVLPFVYLGCSAWLEWINLSRPPTFSVYGRLLFFGLCLSFAGLALNRGAQLIGSRHLSRAWWMPTLISMAGVIALPVRLGAELPTFQSISQHVEASSQARSRAPLLVFGIDGADWHVLRPLIDDGRMPTLRKLIADGVSGNMQALWPPHWSTPAWGAILTGFSQDEIGVHEDLSEKALGLSRFEAPLRADPVLDPLFAIELGLQRLGFLEIVPAPRESLMRKPVWELLSQASRKTAVVAFPFSFPASGQAALVVSDRAFPDLWELLSRQSSDRAGFIAPPSIESDVSSWMAEADSFVQPRLDDMFPARTWPKPADAFFDPIDILRNAIGGDSKRLYAGEKLNRKEADLDVLMVYVTGLDSVAHAFWQYRFPEQFPPRTVAAADITALGPVLDKYAEFLDDQLGVLISTFAQAPNVIVVSDHGEQSGLGFPWRSAHSDQGVLVMAGPDVPHALEQLRVSYYDIVPTILDLQALRPTFPLAGHSLLGINSGPR